MSLSAITRARAAALLFGGAALGALPLPVRAQTSSTIRIATIPTENAAGPYYASDMGFFAKAGLDVEIQSLASAAAVAAAVSSGAVDVGYNAVDVLASIHQKNIPLVVLAPGGEYLSTANFKIAAMVVPAGSTARLAKDLNGKIVASNGLRSFGEAAARVWIDANGGDSTTCKYVEIPFPTMPAALDAGRIDAALITEPFLTVAAKTARVLGYGYDGISKHFLVGAWVATPQWASAHPDLVKRFQAVMHDTAVWANANQAKTGDILAKDLKFDPALVATMVRARYTEQLTPALMQPLIDISAKFNSFKSFPAQDLIYTPPR
jgi:NitT/TauT family transport system substrate-binding protein